MKRKLLFLLLVCAGLCDSHKSSAAVPVSQDADVHPGYFYSSLAPYGEWIETESGNVWHPYNVPENWRPYLLGRWVWTDYGWYWMSDEPFGWITYHYGRWYEDESYGWIWIPDTLWGPAWVDWRYDDDYIGWAPLPPYATFSMSMGIRFMRHWVAPIHYWSFVSYRRFGGAIRYRDVVPEGNARRFFGATRSGLRYEVEHDRIMNRGIDREFIQRRGGTRITRAVVRDGRGQSGERFIGATGNIRDRQIEVFRPSREEIQRGTSHVPMRRGERPYFFHENRDATVHEDSHSPAVGRRRAFSAPQIQDRQSQRDRQKERQKLVERYDRRQRISAPTPRNFSQPRNEQRRESSPRFREQRPSHDRQSGHSERR